MADNITVGLELDAASAAASLARFRQAALIADRAFGDLIKTQEQWAAHTAKSTAQARQNLQSFAQAAIALDKQRSQSFEAAEKQRANTLAKAKRELESFATAAKALETQKQRALQATATATAAATQKQLASLQSFAQAAMVLDKQRTQSLLLQQKQRERLASSALKESQATWSAAQREIAAIKATGKARLSAEAARQKEMASRQRVYMLSLKQTAQLKAERAALAAQAAAVAQTTTKWQRLKTTLVTVFKEQNSLETQLRGLNLTILHGAGAAARFIKSSALLSSDMLGFKNALQLASGSQEAANIQLNKAIAIAKALSLDIETVTRQYSKFINATTLAGLSTAQGEKIFISFAKAARVLNLTAQRTTGVFLALEQMISKGTVSMEELRRQLGDHLPGALNLAAKAMGFSENELGKFIKAVSQGKVESKKLVIALADLVSQKVSGLVPQALEKFSAALQRLSNEVTIFKIIFGEAFAAILTPVLDGFTAILGVVNLLLQPFSSLAGNAQENERVFKELVMRTTDYTAAADGATKAVKTFDEHVAAATIDAEKLDKILSETSFAALAAGGAFIGSTSFLGLGVAAAGLTKLSKAFGWAKAAMKSFVRATLINLALMAARIPFLLHPVTLTLTAIVVSAKVLFEVFKKLAQQDIISSKQIAQTETAGKLTAEYAVEVENLTTKLIDLGEVDTAETLARLTGEMLHFSHAALILNAEIRRYQEYLDSNPIEKFASRFIPFWASDEITEAQNAIPSLQRDVETLLAEAAKFRKALTAPIAQGNNLVGYWADVVKQAESYIEALDVTKLQQQVQLIGEVGIALELLKFKFERQNDLQKTITAANKAGEKNIKAVIAAHHAETAALTQLLQLKLLQTAQEKGRLTFLKENVKVVEDGVKSSQKSILSLKEEAETMNLRASQVREYKAQQLEATQALALHTAQTAVSNAIAAGADDERIKSLRAQLALIQENIVVTQHWSNAVADAAQQANFDTLVAELEPAATATKELSEKLETLWHQVGGEEGQISVTRYYELVNKLLAKNDEAKDKFAEFSQQISEGFSSLFTDFMDGEVTSFEDAMGRIENIFLQTINNMVAEALAAQLTESLMGFAKTAGGSKGIGGFLGNVLGALVTQAKGGAFQGGVQTFASGGVVATPTIFPMAKGAGLMGEAGPEAIMPLKRDKNGNLGVSASGESTTINVTVNSNAGGTDSGASSAQLGKEIAMQLAMARKRNG